MLCYECGYQDSTINGPHTCAEADLKRAARRRAAGQHGTAWLHRGSWAWPTLTWITLAIAVGYGLVCMVRLVALAWEYVSVGQLGDPPTATQRADAISAIHFVQQVSPAYAVAIWVYIAAFVAWFVVVGRIVKGLGAPRQVLQHWTVAAWRIGVVVSVGVVVFLSTPPSNADDLASARAALLDFDGRQMIYTVLRVAIAALLVAAVWILNGRVSKLMSERQSVSV